MKRKFLILFYCSTLIGFSGTAAYAQKLDDPDREVNIWAVKPFKIDGNSEEWHEPLNNFNDATHLAFALANDEQNLYLIIESLDEVTTGRLLRGGLTLNINTAGKKKDGIKLNFLGMQQPPVPGQAPRDSLGVEHEKNSVQRDAGVRVITVSGFKQIPDGALAIPNEKGIQVAAAFNSRRDYICELAIPLAQLDLKGTEVKGIAYQIKMNSSAAHVEHRPEAKGGESSGMGRGGAGMGGMGGMKGGRGGGGGHRGGGMNERRPDGRNESAAAADFWIKYELAKPSDAYRNNSQ